MAGLQSIVTLFRETAESFQGVNTFIYDRVSSINTGAFKEYPALLLDAIPDRENIGYNIHYLPAKKEYSFKIFAYNTYKESEQESVSLDVKLEELELILDQFLAEIQRKTLNDHTLGLTLVPDGRPGFLAKDVHNDKLLQVYLPIKITVNSSCTPGTFS